VNGNDYVDVTADSVLGAEAVAPSLGNAGQTTGTCTDASTNEAALTGNHWMTGGLSESNNSFSIDCYYSNGAGDASIAALDKQLGDSTDAKLDIITEKHILFSFAAKITRIDDNAVNDERSATVTVTISEKDI
jgi:hypothetical protein